jgi:hypothetical protein
MWRLARVTTSHTRTCAEANQDLKGIEGQVSREEGTRPVPPTIAKAVARRTSSTVTARALMTASVSSGAGATHTPATAPERTALFSTITHSGPGVMPEPKPTATPRRK